MRLTSRVELEFLRFTGALLQGRYRPRDGRLPPLRWDRDGLTRDAEGALVRRGLEDQVARAAARVLAEDDGLTPLRFVLGDRQRERALLDPAVFERVGPLRFGRGVVDLLALLHDQALEDVGSRLAGAATLGDMLVYDLCCRALGARVTPEMLEVSPLTALERGLPGGAAPRVRDLPMAEDVAVVLRARSRRTGERWARRVARAWSTRVERQATLLEELGTSLRAFLEGVLEVGRHELLRAYLRFYRILLRETKTPEDVLRDSAASAGTFRRVSDQEAFLRTQAAVFWPAARLEDELARVRATPFVEREEGEKLFHDEFQALAADVLPRAAALHRSLASVLR